MRTAEPGVIRQSRLLRRQVIGTVHLRQVLAQHHSPFQFPCPWVFACTEINDGSPLPPPVPVLYDSLQLLVENQFLLRLSGLLQILSPKGQDVLRRR